MESHVDPNRSVSVVDRICRRLVKRKFERTPVAPIEIREGLKDWSTQPAPRPAIQILDPRFFRRAVIGGKPGSG